jgi:hypothetical protein
MAFKVNRNGPEPAVEFEDKTSSRLSRRLRAEDPSSEQDKFVHHSRDVGEH